MNQRRKLLNAARRGDTKAISKLFELYQVRVLSGEQLAKVNRSSAYLVPVAPAKGGKSAASAKKGKQVPPKSVKAEPKQRAKAPVKKAAEKPAKSSQAKARKARHE